MTPEGYALRELSRPSPFTIDYDAHGHPIAVMKGEWVVMNINPTVRTIACVEEVVRMLNESLKKKLNPM